jgi:hypothetical protein
MLEKKENFISKLAAQIKVWIAETSLRDAKAEKERAVEVKHQFINGLKY